MVNQNAVDDAGPAEYVMYFEYTNRYTNTGFSFTASAGLTTTLGSTTTDLTALTNGDFIKLVYENEHGERLTYLIRITPRGRIVLN